MEPGIITEVDFVRAIDGDTIEVEITRRFSMRLRNIDCPERNTPEGQEAKAEVFTASMIERLDMFLDDAGAVKLEMAEQHAEHLPLTMLYQLEAKTPGTLLAIFAKETSDGTYMFDEAIFIQGKFEPIGTTPPYTPLIQALRQLVRQLLSESSIVIADWKYSLQEALKANGRVISDIIPELELDRGTRCPLIKPEPDARFPDRFRPVVRHHYLLSPSCPI